MHIVKHMTASLGHALDFTACVAHLTIYHAQSRVFSVTCPFKSLPTEKQIATSKNKSAVLIVKRKVTTSIKTKKLTKSHITIKTHRKLHTFAKTSQQRKTKNKKNTKHHKTINQKSQTIRSK